MGQKKLAGGNSLLIIIRILVILLAMSLFVPGLNPAKISSMINDNLSLFTSGLVYSTAYSGFRRALMRGWVEQGTLNLLFLSSMLSCIGFLINGAGGCLSLGLLKFKKASLRLTVLGSLVSLLGFGGIFIAYTQMLSSTNLGKVDPSIPVGIFILGGLSILCIVLSIAAYLLLPKPAKDEKYVMESKYYLFLLIMPFLALCFVFSYLPLWGWRYGLYDFKPGLGLSAKNFVGFKWFRYLLQNSATSSDILRVLKNTLAMSGLGLVTSVFPLIFAIFLSEIKTVRYRKIVQTLTTIPNFISWVLVYAFAFALFSTEGFINTVLVDLGVVKEGVNFLLSGDHIWMKMLAWGLWKGLGWGAIIYLAAISGIDQQLYEAATVDGAGRFKKMWYITVPGLMPTFFVLLMLAIAGILSNGMDQYFVFKNSANKTNIEVLDLYVYLLGLGGSGTGNIPLATVVGMVKSIVSIVLLFMANGLSKLIRKESII